MPNNTINVSQFPKLAIKLNERVGDLCPFCDSPTNANIGAEIVEDSTNIVVCRSCAYKISPHLVALLNFVEAARFFVNTENDFGDKTLQSIGLNWREFDESLNISEVL